MMRKEESIVFMALPILLIALVGLLGSLGADPLIVGFVFIGLGVAGIAGSVVLLALAVVESGFVLVLGFIVALVGGITAIAAGAI